LFVDVGVGPGGISRSLLKKGAQSVIGLEKDEAFKPILEQLRDSSNSNFDFIIGDASDEHDVRLLCKAKCLNKSRVVLLGNLPFSIGGTLLSLWTRQSFLDNGLFETRNVEMTLMFTNAVAKVSFILQSAFFI
jgi:16S rRNA A1518/A1519 N6-dimethyltransferase RsmA/KsgA/DIM1 with predicted DNA glycosylase/AP lyase activity